MEKGSLPYLRAYPGGTGLCASGKSLNIELANTGNSTLEGVAWSLLELFQADKQSGMAMSLPPGAPLPNQAHALSPANLLAPFRTFYGTELQETLLILPDNKHPGACLQTISIQSMWSGDIIWQCCPPKNVRVPFDAMVRR